MHWNPFCADGDKSEIVQFYNETKASVDTLDKLARSYRSQRKSRRWPISVFWALIDIGVMAAMKIMEIDSQENVSHYDFKRDLGYELVMPFIERRSKIPNLQKIIAEAMSKLSIKDEVMNPY